MCWSSTTSSPMMRCTSGGASCLRTSELRSVEMLNFRPPISTSSARGSGAVAAGFALASFGRAKQDMLLEVKAGEGLQGRPPPCKPSRHRLDHLSEPQTRHSQAGTHPGPPSRPSEVLTAAPLNQPRASWERSPPCPLPLSAGRVLDFGRDFRIFSPSEVNQGGVRIGTSKVRLACKTKLSRMKMVQPHPGFGSLL